MKKVEYVKVEFLKLSDAADAANYGNLHFKHNENTIVTDKLLAEYFFETGDLTFYRRVERDVTWQDLLQEFFEKSLTSHESIHPYFEIDDDGVLISGTINNNDFIRMCELVTSAVNGKQD